MYFAGADIAAASVLISMGAVLGQTTFLQLMVMGVFEIAIFAANEYLLIDFFQVKYHLLNYVKNIYLKSLKFNKFKFSIGSYFSARNVIYVLCHFIQYKTNMIYAKYIFRFAIAFFRYGT